jgi:guanosine-3',5'-bis(diphosphate) 3'-pyrophosphohydrolase
MSPDELRESPLAFLFRALEFAARKHRDQRRKGEGAAPYINHPIAVAAVLAGTGGVDAHVTLAAAVLHDTVEDTETTLEELEGEFGVEVRDVVEEVTDDKELTKAERKRLQVEHAPSASRRAKELKLGDKICNIRDLVHAPPGDWTLDRKVEYLDWTEQVVAGCRGTSAALEELYDHELAQARAAMRATREIVDGGEGTTG